MQGFEPRTLPACRRTTTHLVKSPDLANPALSAAAHSPDLPTCAVCMEKLGSYGGPSSLPCGHNGCLQCLQKVQAHNAIPLCPLCRTPFDADLNLGLNLDFKEMLEALQLASSRHLRFDESTICNPEDAYNQLSHHTMNDKPNIAVLHGELKHYPHLPIGGKGPAAVLGNVVSSQPILRGSMNESTHINSKNLQAGMHGESSGLPEVNLRNVLRGVVALMSRKTRSSLEQPNLQGGRLVRESSNRLEEVVDSGADLWTSMHFPSAPPLLTGNGEDATALRAILDSEPPQWIPDSACGSCMQCDAKFQPLRRVRHHCRLCGGIFCSDCSKGKCLMPSKFMEKDPQRVCDGCYERLEPVQQILIGSISNAVQIAIHDVTDITCVRAWLNNPLGSCMQDEIYKAANILTTFSKIGKLKPEQSIPEAVLRGAKGLGILTIAKLGVVLTYKLGTGLIVTQREDGSWSPPVSIMSGGLGWGLQAGGELIDFIIVLRSIQAVKAFSGRLHVSIGAGVSASVGPLGRAAEADLRVGSGGAAACYTYSCSQGAFVGVSLEGNIVGPRPDVNTRFYGDTYLTPDDILFGTVPIPRAADPLYRALHELFSC